MAFVQRLSSLRLKLPLAFSAIALLAALVLGMVLLLGLRNTYAARELDYLRGNAIAASTLLEDVRDDELNAIERLEQLRMFGFLSQTRVRLLDASGGVIADSGTPGVQSRLSTDNPLGALPAFETRISEVLSRPLPAGDRHQVIVYVQSDGVEMTHSVQTGSTGGQVTRNVTIFASPFGYGPEARGRQAVGLPGAGESGFDTPAVGGRRSEQRVQLIERTIGDTPQRTIELSEGPAYGLDVLDSAARAWAVASVVAVLFAAAVGAWLSRGMTRPLLALQAVTERMAAGDLGACADAARGDELGALAASYNAMAGQVQRTVLALSTFAGDAAHELNTPLTALRTDLELAVDHDAASGQANPWLNRAQAQAGRMQALAQNMLALARVEGARTQPARLDLGALLRAGVLGLASRAEMAEIALSLDAPVSPLWVLGDASQLNSAIHNLLDNALKFTPAGGRVEVRLMREPAQARLSISDTGIGVPPDDQPALFERFHRARNAHAHAGSGLGLALVRAVAQQHGGGATLFSDGSGSIATLYLPLEGVKCARP